MNSSRKEYEVAGLYVRPRCGGEVFKTTKMIVQDEEKGTYYVTDTGEEVLGGDCHRIELPSQKDFEDILKKYPNAFEMKSNQLSKMQISIVEDLTKRYGEATNMALLNELRHYKKECRRIEKLLGIE